MQKKNVNCIVNKKEWDRILFIYHSMIQLQNLRENGIERLWGKNELQNMNNLNIRLHSQEKPNDNRIISAVSWDSLKLYT